MVTNPYRTGSKLWTIFHLMSGGKSFTLKDLTTAVYLFSAGNNSLNRRRVASALRTIRKLPLYWVDFKDGKYQLWPAGPKGPYL